MLTFIVTFSGWVRGLVWFWLPWGDVGIWEANVTRCDCICIWLCWITGSLLWVRTVGEAKMNYYYYKNMICNDSFLFENSPCSVLTITGGGFCWIVGAGITRFTTDWEAAGKTGTNCVGLTITGKLLMELDCIKPIPVECVWLMFSILLLLLLGVTCINCVGCKWSLCIT